MKAQEYKNTIENLRKAREEAVISISEKEKLKEAEKILDILKVVSEGSYKEAVENENSR